jgi:prepilin-type N-terminal cleavage/methylation domain-containing protein
VIDPSSGRSPANLQAGFTLIELMISVAILMVVSGLMLRGTLDMSRLNAQQANRSEMHAGIRNATALLQQEVGQAGRVALPGDVTLSTAAAVGDQWTSLSPSIASIFVGEQLVIGRADIEEIVTVLDINPVANKIRANFTSAHDAGSRVMPAGGFAEGIIPTTRTNGSTASVLKILGDINGDGNLMYVEYTCNWNSGRLSRNMMTYAAASKPALTVEQVLLDNLLPNPSDPDGTARPCFTYEQRTINSTTYVINVAIMTTVRTDEKDPTTGQFQSVTKALLNVAPRNVFQVWQMASLNYQNRIQPLPASVVNLLP